MFRTTALTAVFAAVFIVTAGIIAREPSAIDFPITEPAPTDYDQPIQPDLYVIRPGEPITITFLKSQLPTLTLRVSQEGKIIDPAIGQFVVAGKTLSELRTLLHDPITRVYSAPDFYLAVGAPYQISVSVSGAVKSPGFYRGYTSERITDLIESAGGLTANASSRRITFNGGQKNLTVDLDRAIALGDHAANPCLYAGSHISVPARSGDVVQVVGAVQRPHEIELLPTDDLPLLIALAGGYRDDADTAAVRVLGDPGRNPRVTGNIHPGDVILVPVQSMDQVASRLLIVGEVATPGPYPYRSGLTLDSLLAAAGHLTPRANPSRIAVFRRAEPDIWGTAFSSRYPVMTGGQFGSRRMDIPLMPGDSIAVPLIQGFVRVSGLVRVPGLYPFTPDQNAGYYLDLAGGITSGATPRMITLYDRITRLTITADKATVISDGDEIIVNAMENTP